jgi:hypothetical protein
MLNKQIFNYAEERIEAMACHNIALWHKLVVAEQAEAARQEYYFQRC